VRNSAITLQSTKGCKVTIKAQLTGDTIASACGVFACNSSPVIDLMPSAYRRWLWCAVSCETKAGPIRPSPGLGDICQAAAWLVQKWALALHMSAFDRSGHQ